MNFCKRYLGVWSSACAAAPGLDAEQVAEEGGDEVMVDKSPGLLVYRQEGEDAHSLRGVVSQDHHVGVLLPSLKGTPSTNLKWKFAYEEVDSGILSNRFCSTVSYKSG